MSSKSLDIKGPIHWVLDWDGTITKKDTLNVLVNIAASAKPNFPTSERWKTVVQAYMVDYTATLEKLAPDSALPTTILEEKKLLKALKVVEQRSLDRVFDSNIFRGLTGRILGQGAEEAIKSGQVALRPGCADLLRRLSTFANSKADILNILSVNWSRHFISSSLIAAGAPVKITSIYANELDGIAEGKSSSGQISPVGDVKIIASDDKLHYLEEMRDASKAPVVYVGDSWTDIECLLAADLGICIRDEPMGSSQKKLAEALERLGIACPRLQDLTEADGLRIAWANHFVEIQGWVERNLVR